MPLTRSTRLIACLTFLIPALTLSAVADETPPVTHITTDGLRFNYIDTPFNEILEQFAAPTGRQVTGPVPTDEVTLDTGREEMTFDVALARVQLTAFSLDQRWVRPLRNTNELEVIRLSDQKGHSLECIFVRVDEFARNSTCVVAMLLQDCRYSPAATIAEYRTLFPSYVVSAPYPHRESLTLFAAAGDLRLYSPLLDMLDIALQDDAAVVAEVKLRYVEPAVYAEVLRMFLPGTIEYQRLERQRYQEPADEEPPLRVWTDWAHRRAVVVGSPFAVGRAETFASILDHSCFPIMAPHAPSPIQPRP